MRGAWSASLLQHFGSSTFSNRLLRAACAAKTYYNGVALLLCGCSCCAFICGVAGCARQSLRKLCCVFAAARKLLRCGYACRASHLICCEQINIQLLYLCIAECCACCMRVACACAMLRAAYNESEASTVCSFLQRMQPQQSGTEAAPTKQQQAQHVGAMVSSQVADALSMPHCASVSGALQLLVLGLALFRGAGTARQISGAFSHHKGCVQQWQASLKQSVKPDVSMWGRHACVRAHGMLARRKMGCTHFGRCAGPLLLAAPTYNVHVCFWKVGAVCSRVLSCCLQNVFFFATGWQHADGQRVSRPACGLPKTITLCMV